MQLMISRHFALEAEKELRIKKGEAGSVTMIPNIKSISKFSHGRTCFFDLDYIAVHIGALR